MTSEYTPADLASLKELIESQHWYVFRKIFAEQRGLFYVEYSNTEKDHRYKQGKLHGLEQFWKRLEELSRMQMAEAEIDLAEATEQAWLRQGGVGIQEEEEPSERDWVKR